MAEAGGEGGQQEGFMNSLARTMFMMFAMNVLVRKIMHNPEAERKKEYGGMAAQAGEKANSKVWPGGEALALAVYISNSSELNADAHRLWTEDELWNDDKGMVRGKKFFFEKDHQVLSNVWENETVYAHAVLGLRDKEWVSCDGPSVICTMTSAPLTRYLPRAKHKAKRALLSEGQERNDFLDNEEDEEETSMIDMYWKPTLSIRLVVLPPQLDRDHTPQHLQKKLRFNRRGEQLPLLEIDEFWLTRKNCIQVNASVPNLNLEASLARVHFMRWNLQQSLDSHWEMQRSLGLAAEGDADMIREILADTSPWLLIVTGIVSLLHMIFESLTLRSNVKFWRNKKNLLGLSARTIGFHCFTQAIVLLYLLDNESSWMILISNFLGLATELWKLTKALTLKRDPNTGKLAVQVEEEYAQSSTREYDKIATDHLLYGAIPLCIGFALYSLLYSQHKSWYSWIITSLVAYLYTFGFLAMTPQLYINYRLQSVAHLPWKAMTYKALNTVADDFAAFIIKQPFLHRLACFRDDIIFLAMLYQRYKYGVDMSRVNEFGEEFDSTSVQPAVDDESTLKKTLEEDTAPTEDNSDEVTVDDIDSPPSTDPAGSPFQSPSTAD